MPRATGRRREAAEDESSNGHQHAWSFVRACIREPLKVGAIWPSSERLSRVVTDACDFAPDDTVVELGPGTGNFTRLLLDRIDQRGRLVAVENSATNIQIMRSRFPNAEIVFDSAEHLARHVEPRTARCIVSGLAWSNMLPAMQDRVMVAVTRSLKPGGQFVGFAYTHARYYPTTLRFRQLMLREFARVETTPIVWRNLPPAYVYSCWS